MPVAPAPRRPPTSSGLPALPAPTVEMVDGAPPNVTSFDLSRTSDGTLELAYAWSQTWGSKLGLATLDDGWDIAELGDGSNPHLTRDRSGALHMFFKEPVGAVGAGDRMAYATQLDGWSSLALSADTEPHVTHDLSIAVDADDTVHVAFKGPANDLGDRTVLWHGELQGEEFVFEVIDDAGVDGTAVGRSPRLLAAEDGELHLGYTRWVDSELQLAYAVGTTDDWELRDVDTSAMPQVFDMALSPNGEASFAVAAADQGMAQGLWWLSGPGFDEALVDPDAALWAVALAVDEEGAPHIAAVDWAPISQQAPVSYYRPSADGFERTELYTDAGNGGAIDIVVGDDRLPSIVAKGGGVDMTFVHFGQAR